MYFITVMSEPSPQDHLGVWIHPDFERCWGYYKDLEKAKDVLTHNCTNLWEELYDYAVIEDIDDTSPFPTKIRPGMCWHGHDIQKDAVTGEVYVSRIRSTEVKAVVELQIGPCTHRCLQLVMFSTNADGVGAPTLIEKYIDANGLTSLRRKYMGEDNPGGREQLRRSPWIERDSMRHYLWYDSVFL